MYTGLLPGKGANPAGTPIPPDRGAMRGADRPAAKGGEPIASVIGCSIVVAENLRHFGDDLPVADRCQLQDTEDVPAELSPRVELQGPFRSPQFVLDPI
jgi:hypothetical protein